MKTTSVENDPPSREASEDGRSLKNSNLAGEAPAFPGHCAVGETPVSARLRRDESALPGDADESDQGERGEVKGEKSEMVQSKHR